MTNPDSQFGQQLVLPVGIRSDASFQNFFGPDAQRCSAFLQRALAHEDDTLIWITGPEGAGKSHLAAACLHFLEQQGRSAFYLGLGELQQDVSWVSYFLEDAQSADVLILDDLQEWLPGDASEAALFQLYNHFKICGQQLVVTANKAPANFDVRLADLASRLRAAQVLALGQLDDADKQQVLMGVAAERGMALGDDVASFVIRRSGRNLGQLLDVLEQLERASLIEQRKLTVPFVKKVLAW